MAIEIRRADRNEANVVALLGRLTFRETFNHLFEHHQNDLQEYLDRTFSVAKIESSIDKARNSYWIASLDGLPIGYAKLKWPSESALVGEVKAAQLQKIYVLAEFASRGAGRVLMRTIENEVARLSPGALWLNVLTANRRAILFYEGQGWARIGFARFAIGAQTFDFLTMRARQSGDAAEPASSPPSMVTSVSVT